MTNLNWQWIENSSLFNDQIKALSKHVRFVVKSFRYIGRLNIRLAKLEFYITKLAEAIRFDPRRLHEVTYQGQILEWE